MEITDWEKYRAATSDAEKRRILGQIVQDNEKFIVANVQRLVRRGLVSPMSSISDVPLEDLVQAGRMGYLRALEKFDPKRGAFPTYAVHWIRHEVQQAALVETTIRKPKDSGIPFSALTRRNKIWAQYGREATAEELGLDQDVLDRWRTRSATVTAYEEHYSGSDTPGTDLNNDEKDGATAAMQHWLEDHEAMDPEQILGLKELHGAVDKLPEKEKAVIKAMYFSEKSLDQVLHELGIPCSTLYEIRDAALARLREEV